MIRRLFYRGRHHVRTAPRPADGALVTVSTIAARLRREARERAYGRGVGWVRVIPDVAPFDQAVRRAFRELAIA